MGSLLIDASTNLEEVLKSDRLMKDGGGRKKKIPMVTTSPNPQLSLPLRHTRAPHSHVAVCGLGWLAGWAVDGSQLRGTPIFARSGMVQLFDVAVCSLVNCIAAFFRISRQQTRRTLIFPEFPLILSHFDTASDITCRPRPRKLRHISQPARLQPERWSPSLGVRERGRERPSR